MASRRKSPKNRPPAPHADGEPEHGPPLPRVDGSLDRALLVACVVAVGLLFTCSALRRIWGADFWWQYRTGRLVSASGPPSVDIFSYTAAGHPWIETRWLYCWILYKAIALAGFPAAVLGKWALGAASYALVAAVAVTRRTVVPACAVLFVAILASSQRLFVRPEMVSYFFTALFIAMIARYRARGGRAIWALAPLTVVWANMHSFSAFGPILIGFLLVVSLAEEFDNRAEPAQTRRDLRARTFTAAGLFGGSSLALLLTPYGLRGVALQIQLFSEIHGTAFKESITEFWSPFAFAQHYTAVMWWYALAGLGIVSALAALRRLEPFLTLTALALFYLSATSIRNIPLFALAAVPFVLWNLRESPLATGMGRAGRKGRELPPGPWIWGGRALGIAIVAASAITSLDFVTDRFNVQQNDTNQFGVGLATHTFADRAVAFYRAQGLEGPVFNTMFEGAYLIQSDIPDFIDPRLEVHGEAAFARYMRMQDDQATWNEESRARGFHTAIVDLQSGFLPRIVAQGGWALVYFDDVVALFARTDHLGEARPIAQSQDFPPIVDQLRAALPRPVPGADSRFARVASPLPSLRLASFLMSQGQVGLAETLAADALAAWPSTSGAHALRAKILSVRGDHAGAAAEYEAELRSDQSRPLPIERLLAFEYFAAGRADRARPALEKLTADLPHDHVAWGALTKLYAEAGRGADALRCAQQAIALAPRNPEYRKNLGRSQALAGDRTAAAATLEKALRLDPLDASVAQDLATLYKTVDPDKARGYLALRDRLRAGG